MTSDEPALLAAILAAPEEDTPRLVFADWLDENAGTVRKCMGQHQHAGKVGQELHGIVHTTDPRQLHHHCDEKCEVSDGRRERAEFIRVQCALARCGPQHKRTQYPDEPHPLKRYGNKHYSIHGYDSDGFAVGDRIDLLVQRPRSRPKWVYGFRVYKVVPRTEPHERGESEVFLRLDDQSGKWEGAKLQARARELFMQHAASWVPVPAGHTLSVALVDECRGTCCVNASYAAGNVKESGDLQFYFSRGFCSEWWGPLLDMQRYRRAVFSQPIQAVTLTERQANNYADGGYGDAIYRWDVCEWSDIIRHGDFPGYIPREIWACEELSIPDIGTVRQPRSFFTRELADAALSQACVRYGRRVASQQPSRRELIEDAARRDGIAPGGDIIEWVNVFDDARDWVTPHTCVGDEPFLYHAVAGIATADERIVRTIYHRCRDFICDKQRVPVHVGRCDRCKITYLSAPSA